MNGRNPYFQAAAGLAFLAVALGAFGAHGLQERLGRNGLAAVWEKAALYHFLHALALLVISVLGTVPRTAWWLLAAGIGLFSGSLYLLAFSGVRWLGAITPLGGLCFLVGWALLAFRPSEAK